MNITTTTDQLLKDIAFALDRIASVLEKQNKPKGLSIPLGPFASTTDCISKEEIPLPTPWNNPNIPVSTNDVLR
jgi:hypothetical protein